MRIFNSFNIPKFSISSHLRFNLKKDLKYDSFLVAFLPFLYGLANIFSVVGSISAGIIFLTVLALLPSIFLQPQRWIKSLGLLFLVILLILPQLFIYPKNEEGIVSSLIALCSLGFVGLYIGSSDYKIEWVIKYSYKLALVNFACNIIYLMKNSDDIDTLSMRFGYGFLPSVMFLLLSAITKKNKTSLLLSIIGLFLLLILGSRGCMICIIAFVLMYYGKKYIVQLVIACTALFLFKDLLIDFLLWGIDSLPFETYKLNKMITMLTSGIEAASSGRDYLYQFYFDKFTKNPEGLGIGYNSTIGMLYPHNIILQIGIEFGLIGLAIWILYEILIFKRIIQLRGDKFNFMIIIFAITNGRLMVSSNFWERPEWWFLMALIFHSIVINKNSLKGVPLNPHS